MKDYLEMNNNVVIYKHKRPILFYGKKVENLNNYINNSFVVFCGSPLGEIVLWQSN